MHYCCCLLQRKNRVLQEGLFREKKFQEIGQPNATVLIVVQHCLLFYNSKKYPVIVQPISSLFSFCVQQYVSDLYLTANWPATLHTTPTAHPVENLCAINRPFRVFMFTTACLSRMCLLRTRSACREHTCTHQVFKNIKHILLCRP